MDRTASACTVGVGLKGEFLMAIFIVVGVCTVIAGVLVCVRYKHDKEDEDPKNPKTFYFADEEQKFSYMGITLIVGRAVMAIIGIIFLLSIYLTRR